MMTAFFREYGVLRFRMVAILLCLLILAANCWANSKDIFFHDMEGDYALLAGDLIPGKSYYLNEYKGGNSIVQEERYDVEYVVGNLPIIISVPHGGGTTPDGISNNNGSIYTDRETIPMANELYLKIHQLTGGYPHIIISRIYRKKLDMNRYYLDSECMDDYRSGSRTKIAWDDYHFFIDEAKRRSVEDYGFGFFLDLHGQSADSKSQVGYGLTKYSLTLNSKSNINSEVSRNALAYLSEVSGTSFYDLLFGKDGLGEILHEKAYDHGIRGNDNDVYPSRTDDDTGSPYFSGHYNVFRHCGMNTADQYERIYPFFSNSRIQYMVDEYDQEFSDPLFISESGASKISGAILELNGDVRDNHKEEMCWAIADALIEYIEYHYDTSLTVPADTVTLLDEGFETKRSVNSWAGEWQRTKEEASYGDASMRADDDHQGDFTSPSLDCEDATEITVSFNFRKHNLGDDDLNLYFGNGEEFQEIPIKIDEQGTNDGWIFYSVTTDNPGFFTDNFQVRFTTTSLQNSIYGNDELFIDSVHVMKKTGGEMKNTDDSQANGSILNPFNILRYFFSILGLSG